MFTTKEEQQRSLRITVFNEDTKSSYLVCFIFSLIKIDNFWKCYYTKTLKWQKAEVTDTNNRHSILRRCEDTKDKFTKLFISWTEHLR